MDDPGFWTTIGTKLEALGPAGAFIFGLSTAFLFWLRERDLRAHRSALEAKDEDCNEQSRQVLALTRETLQAIFEITAVVKSLAESSPAMRVTLDAVANSIALLSDRVNSRRRP